MSVDRIKADTYVLHINPQQGSPVDGDSVSWFASVLYHEREHVAQGQRGQWGSTPAEEALSEARAFRAQAQKAGELGLSRVQTRYTVLLARQHHAIARHLRLIDAAVDGHRVPRDQLMKAQGERRLWDSRVRKFRDAHQAQ